MVLPVALLASSLAFLLHPFAAALMETNDDGLSNSVYRASVEVLTERIRRTPEAI